MHVVHGMIRKETAVKQLSESTMFIVELAEMVKDRNTGEKNYTNYKAMIFAKTQPAIDFYTSATAIGSYVVLNSEKLKIDKFEANSGVTYITLMMENARLEAAHVGSQQPAPQQAPQQAPAQQSWGNAPQQAPTPQQAPQQAPAYQAPAQQAPQQAPAQQSRGNAPQQAPAPKAAPQMAPAHQPPAQNKPAQQAPQGAPQHAPQQALAQYNEPSTSFDEDIIPF